MNDSLLSKYVRKPANEPRPKTVPNGDPDGTEDLGCYGFLRGVRDRAVMLELRKKDGTVTALAYAYIERITYCPDGPEEGITLHGAGQKVHISGRNLNTENESGIRLLGALTRHRVPWVREADRAASAVSENDTTVIDAIQ
jgi:hypothetical protein